ncbi:unnamed protein product [Rotaria socialis]|uniref:Uncharacterized protein n=2 Tax=Rotaria socialis TaxID=392032 RepID=A0A821FXL5_9BILA|nr:unnamed protein product [Rotaria socialis]CAF3400148.1 unnamed protein product [Rotaria socialis]CAF3418531.1 unnamed protein product [Rotaria socialis]CAF3591906.1 unnamed protein product [Rotaria socialis]CAF4430281.1 unnamed protein product [Rotaria socialis]
MMEIYFPMFMFICTHMIILASDENEIVPYQSLCHPSTNNGECSDNINCRCSTIVPTGERICTLSVECTSAIPCDSDYSCSATDSICVKDNRCNGAFLCYPIELSSPETCQPLATNDNINNV